jgi:hypothetical protein
MHDEEQEGVRFVTALPSLGLMPVDVGIAARTPEAIRLAV